MKYSKKKQAKNKVAYREVYVRIQELPKKLFF